MQEIVICSGKGGAGKTTITAILFSLVNTRIICDCDVEGANLHLLLNGTPQKTFPAHLSNVAYINPEKCILCGKCIQHCRFNSIKKTQNTMEVIPEKCEGCKVCQIVCPTEAIEMTFQKTGDIILYNSPYGILVSAELTAGSGNSGRLTSQLKQIARQKAQELKENILIIDGPPGIGCPTIATLTGASVVVVIVESSPSGIEDANRLIKLAKQMKIPYYAIINKAGINSSIDERTKKMLQQNNCPTIATISYDLNIPKQMKNNLLPKSQQIETACQLIAKKLNLPIKQDYK